MTQSAISEPFRPWPSRSKTARPDFIKAEQTWRWHWRKWVARRLQNRKPQTDQLQFKPRAILIGTPEIADRMFRGIFSFNGIGIRSKDGNPWHLMPPSEDWAEHLHSFRWLEHFAAAGGFNATEHAQFLVQKWLSSHASCQAPDATIAWRPAIIADRLTSWLTFQSIIIENANMLYRDKVLRAIEAQAIFLDRYAYTELRPLRQLAIGVAQGLTSLCLPLSQKSIESCEQIIQKALESLLLADGTPVSRSPSDLLDILTRLAVFRIAMHDAGKPLNPTILEHETRALQMLRYLRHSDGGLALFNGGREGRDQRIDRLLAEGDLHQTKITHAQQGGFERLAHGRTTVLLDAGEPLTAGQKNAHAGALSLEMSSAGRRIIVNCGSAAHMSPDLYQNLRETSAHSTLSVAQLNSAHFNHKHRPHKQAFTPAPIIERECIQDTQGTWLRVKHEGYAQTFGLGHQRRLFLSVNGEDLRGEDTLYTLTGHAQTLQNARQEIGELNGLDYDLRFHLHPEITAQIDPNGSGAWLYLPEGECWFFQQVGGMLTVENSTYFGHAAPPTETLHLRVAARFTEDNAMLKWQFKRMTNNQQAAHKTARDPKALRTEPLIKTPV